MTSFPVVALHSIGLDSSEFDGIAAALGGRALIALDLPGHGSAVNRVPADLAELAADVSARLPTQPFHLVGHSLGGVVAATVSQNSHAVSLAVLGAPSRAYDSFAARARQTEVPIDDTLHRWFTQADLAAGTPAVAAATECLMSMDPEGWRAAWSALAGFEGVGTLHVTEPTLCICAEDDVSTPPAESAAYAAAIAGSRVASIPSGGHAFPLSRADEAAAILENWFTDVEKELDHGH